MTPTGLPEDAHPLVQVACGEAEWLRGEAARLERSGVTRVDTDRLAAAGLYAVGAPGASGGVPGPIGRRIAEVLAGASPDAWFVWFQHGPVLKMLGASPNLALADRWLAELASGRQQAGVAFSHLRSPRPTVTATPVGTGWSLDGVQAWCTGFGVVDVVLVGAVTRGPVSDPPEVLLALVPAAERTRPPGFTSAAALELAAMGGTSTHSVRFDGVLVDSADVVVRLPYAEWSAGDRIATPNLLPSTVGVALAAAELVADRDAAAGTALRDEVLAVRAEAYQLLDEVPPADERERRLALRAQGMELALRACAAALAARGGSGMAATSPEQRLLRAAGFGLVHAQTQDVREATLRLAVRDRAAA